MYSFSKERFAARGEKGADVIVTISSEYGSGGLGAGRIVAQRLGCKFVDRQLPVVVAKRLGVSSEAVSASEDASTTMSERVLRGLELGTPELGSVVQEGESFDDEVAREVQQAIREYAERGDCVIIGRGASEVLGRRPDVVRVFMHAPRDWRIHQIMEQHGVDQRTATAEVDRVDRGRRAYMRTYFGIDWGSPENYDLSIDAASFGPEGSAELVVRAVELRG